MKFLNVEIHNLCCYYSGAGGHHPHSEQTEHTIKDPVSTAPLRTSLSDSVSVFSSSSYRIQLDCMFFTEKHFIYSFLLYHGGLTALRKQTLDFWCYMALVWKSSC